MYLKFNNCIETYRGVADAPRLKLIILTVLFKHTFCGFNRVTAAPPHTVILYKKIEGYSKPIKEFYCHGNCEYCKQ